MHCSWCDLYDKRHRYAEDEAGRGRRVLSVECQKEHVSCATDPSEGLGCEDECDSRWRSENWTTFGVHMGLAESSVFKCSFLRLPDPKRSRSDLGVLPTHALRRRWLGLWILVATVCGYAKAHIARSSQRILYKYSTSCLSVVAGAFCMYADSRSKTTVPYHLQQILRLPQVTV